MTSQRRHPGTPNHQAVSARTGHQTKTSIARPLRTPADLARESQTRAFRSGLAVGAALAFIALGMVFAAVLNLWVLPTMDGAVADAQAVVYGGAS